MKPSKELKGLKKCFNCQIFEHIAKNCTTAHRCVNCTKADPTQLIATEVPHC